MPSDWKSVSVLDDPWEVEIDANAKDSYRYRSACLGTIRTEWAYGRPPSGAHASEEMKQYARRDADWNAYAQNVGYVLNVQAAFNAGWEARKRAEIEMMLVGMRKTL